MPGRNRVPSFQLASGTTDERDGSYNLLNTLGSIFYNTDTSNVEFSDNVDISGKLVVHDSVTFPFMGFRCKMTSGSRTYTTGSTFYYDTTVIDTENGVTQTPGDPSTKYTIPKTGYWSFYAQLASYSQSILLEIRNGSTLILSGGSGSGAFANAEISGVAYCEVGDVISTTQGHNNTVQARTAEGIPQFQGFYVGS